MADTGGTLTEAGLGKDGASGTAVRTTGSDNEAEGLARTGAGGGAETVAVKGAETGPERGAETGDEAGLEAAAAGA